MNEDEFVVNIVKDIKELVNLHNKKILDDVKINVYKVNTLYKESCDKDIFYEICVKINYFEKGLKKLILDNLLFKYKDIDYYIYFE